MPEEIQISSDGTSATLSQKITAPSTIVIYRQEASGKSDTEWFTIKQTKSSSSSGGGPVNP